MNRYTFAPLTLHQLISLLPVNRLCAALGVDEQGEPAFIAVPEACPMLILGQAGIGKTHLMQSLLAQLVATNDADHLRLVLIDPSQETRHFFRGLPHMDRARLLESGATKVLPAIVESSDPQPYTLIVADESLAFRGLLPQLWQHFQWLAARDGGERFGVLAVAQSQPPELPFRSRLFFRYHQPEIDRLALEDKARLQLHRLSQEHQIGRFFVDRQTEGLISANHESTIFPRINTPTLVAPTVTREILQEVLRGFQGK